MHAPSLTRAASEVTKASIADIGRGYGHYFITVRLRQAYAVACTMRRNCMLELDGATATTLSHVRVSCAVGGGSLYHVP